MVDVIADSTALYLEGLLMLFPTAYHVMYERGMEGPQQEVSLLVS